MPTDPSHKQTLSFLMRRFAEVGIRPRTGLGQNFLIDLNLLRLLVDSARLGPDDVVLEVGTGTGSVTAMVAPHVAAVVTVEVDRQMFQLASEELHEVRNVHMLQVDALRNKNGLNPQVLEAVYRELDAAPGRQFKLVANLPYVIATPLLTNLLALDRPPRSMTATIQKELADRMVASPGSKDFGALSLWMQVQCRAQIVRLMAPSVFWPRPKVTSAIVHIDVDDALRGRVPDLPFFHRFVRELFIHRRKSLRPQLIAALKDRLGKPEVDQLLAQLGLDASLRAEQLDVDTVLALCEAVRQRVHA
jgi:16S rRNA (adenine1518-N6/adenine1519-N6)-dimethyltransferase